MKNQADPYGRGSYCIVVAMHGDQSREAEVLREFRDTYLREILLGETLVNVYYSFSPKFNSKVSAQSLPGRMTSAVISSFARIVDLFLV